MLREARADLDALEPAGSAAQSAAMFGGSTEPELEPVDAAEVVLRQAEAALLKPSLLAAVARSGYALDASASGGFGVPEPAAVSKAHTPVPASGMMHTRPSDLLPRLVGLRLEKKVVDSSEPDSVGPQRRR